MEFRVPVGLPCVWISLLPWNQLPKFVEQKGVPRIRIQGLGNNQFSPLGERLLAAGRDRGCEQEMVWGKWAGVAAGRLPPGRMERAGWWGGTGQVEMGRGSAGAHSTPDMWLRGPQIEGSTGGWKAGDGHTKRRAIVIINSSNHWRVTIL